MKSNIRQLALDTLYDRKDENTEDKQSCFVVNEAGQQLRGCGAEAIPVLEELIRDLVTPAMAEYREQNGIPDWSSMLREGPPFAGLNDFLGAYWIICARAEPVHAIKFMNEMTRPVITESVSRLPIFFNPKHPLSNVALPLEYVDYINQLSESNVGEFNAVALHVIENLGLTRKSKKVSSN